MPKSEEEKRRSRISSMKRLIVAYLLLGILIPILLCILLFIKVDRLQKELDQMQRQIASQQKESTMAPEQADPANADTEAGLQTDGLQADSSLAKWQTEETEPDDGQKRKVYLTFDDGPSSNTDAILDILKQYDVKATFFVTGKPQEQYQAMYQRIAAEGHTLGMHSYSHKYEEIYASEEAFEEDLSKLQDFLYDTTGVWSHFYRFPGGSSNQVSTVDMRELAAYMQQQDIYYLDWNVASGDATNKKIKAQTLVDNVLTGVGKHQTSVVLLHDAANKNATVEALPAIIEGVQAMEDTVLLPVSDDMELVQHLKIQQSTAQQ